MLVLDSNEPPYKAPETLPTTTRCRLLLIPDDLNIVFAINDVLTSLADVSVWQSSAEVSAQDVVSSLLQMMLEDECMSVCDDLQFQITDGFLEVKCGDGDWVNVGPVTGTNGTDGVDGREIELQTSATHIQWRYVGDTAWTNLVTLASLTGPQGSQGIQGIQGPAGPKIVGTILMYASSSVPAGCLACDGTIYLKATYQALADALGSAWATDATHFKVPDFRGRAPIGTGTGSGLTARAMGDNVGAETHVLTAGQMPSHTHAAPMRNASVGAGTIAARSSSSSQETTVTTSSAGSDVAHNNMQPSLAVGFCIVAVA